MRSIFAAFLASVATHGLLALGLVVYLDYAPGPEFLATLDLTSVELSFAEKVEESAAVAPVLPSPPPEKQPTPKAEEKPPEQKIKKLQAPDPLATKFPEPKEEPPEMEEIVRQSPPPPDPEPPQEPDRQTRQSSNQAVNQSVNQAIFPSVAPRQAKVDAPPKPRRNIKPDYPRESRLRGECGDVTLEIEVAADGSVSAVRVVKSPGFALLEEAAVKAARAARFTPAKSGGKSVASTVRLTLNFKLK